jgi:hypothetical protein
MAYKAWKSLFRSLSERWKPTRHDVESHVISSLRVSLFRELRTPMPKVHIKMIARQHRLHVVIYVLL